MSSQQSSSELVSVVIPTYYRNDYLESVLKSVFSQTYEPIEIIVVDDSGEAFARSVVEEYPEVRYVAFEENEGAQAARTRGIRQASGAYVNLLDDDDRLKPEKIEKQVELIRTDPDIGVVYCGKEWENGHEIRPDPDIRGDVLHDALRFRTTPSSPSAMLIDRRLLVDLLPLADRPGGDDLGLKIELARRTQFNFVDESLLIQGDDEDSRGGSMGAVEGRKRILDEYSDLYESVPRSVYRYALAHTLLLEAEVVLHETVWSPAAIKAAVLALYYVPGVPVSFFGYAVMSLFGRPGRRFGGKVYHRFVLGNGHRGGLT